MAIEFEGRRPTYPSITGGAIVTFIAVVAIILTFIWLRPYSYDVPSTPAQPVVEPATRTGMQSGSGPSAPIIATPPASNTKAQPGITPGTPAPVVPSAPTAPNIPQPTPPSAVPPVQAPAKAP
jgi:hypothetical protein